MTITTKPKKVREPAAPKPKFTTRPPGEILEELKGKPANGEPRPFFPLIYKTAILDKCLLPDYRWVLMELGPDADLAVKLLANRLTGEDIDLGDFTVTGHTDGLHAYQDGDDVGTWPYSQLYAELLAFGTTEQLRLAGIKQPHKGVVPKPAKTEQAKPNEHGVVESGCETVRIPLPAASKCKAEIRLAQLADGWRFGYEFGHAEGGSSGGPNAKGTAYPSRDRALITAAIEARDYFVEAEERASAAGKGRLRKAVSAVQDYIDQLPPDEPPPKVKAEARRDPPGHSPPPRVPAEALKPPGRELAKTVATGLMIDLAQLERHPENRQPAEKDVDERAASLQEDGQLEDVEVRQIADGKYQILSGETRYKAAKQLGWTQLRCRVVECDDAEASMRVGLHNGQRTDLNPIQKAQRIQYLCERHGRTREEAARAVGLEAGSAASNLLRLLKLPQAWQDRIASGEFPESFARTLAAYAHVEPLMKELDRLWIEGDDYETGLFNSRDKLERGIQDVLPECCRILDEERYYGVEQIYAYYKCLLSAEELAANRDKLGIVTVLRKQWIRTGKGGKTEKCETREVEIATNVELFDKLQIAKILEQRKAQGKAKAAAAGKAADAGESKPKPKSAADIKRAKEERAEQLGRAIDDWLETVMRREVAAAIRALKPSPKVDIRILKLVLGFVCDNSVSQNLAKERIGQLLGTKSVLGSMQFCDPHQIVALSFTEKAKSVLDCKGCQVSAWHKAAAELCAWLIGGDAKTTCPAELTDKTLETVWLEWGCSIEAAWQKLWKAKDPLCEEFLQLHRKDELSSLAWEMQGMKFGDNSSKDGMIAGLLNAHSVPLLPKSLQPAKGKRGGK